MKQLLTLFLLVLLGYIHLGYYPHIMLLRRGARKEFQEKRKKTLPHSALEVFEWNTIKDKVRWEEEEKEFWLNDQLYDIVRVTAEKGNKKSILL